MKFVLDENVPREICKLLRERGHQCNTLVELKKTGIENGALAQCTIETRSVIITGDSDFLALKRDMQMQMRIIYFKLLSRDPKLMQDLLVKHLGSCIALLKKPGKIIITEDGCSFKKPLEK